MARCAISLLLLVGPVLLSGLFSCETCHPAPYRYGIETYRTYPRSITKQTNQPYLTDTLASRDTVSYQDLELILVGKQVILATHNQPTLNSAVWACDPAYVPVDSIKQLTITSTQAYATSFSIGSDLSAIMTIEQDSYDRKPIAAFLAMPFAQAQPFFALRFTKAPDRLAAHQFRITVDLGRGHTSSFLTRPILIKP